MWAPTISSDELYHHGIKGQKHGIRNGPPYPLNRSDYSAKEKRYAKQNLKNAKIQNVDKWGKSRDNNILYIRGVSGSGKSTVANSYKDDKTSVIHLDLYTEKQNLKNKDRNSRLDAYLKVKKFDPKSMSTAEKDKMKRFQNIDKFTEYMQEWSKLEYDKGRKVICEGVQLNDNTMFEDTETFLKDKPLITLTTNESLASKRAKRRDKDK